MVEKISVDERFICPYCEKPVRLRIVEEVITPAVKAEKEKKVFVEKDVQTTL